MRAVYLKTYDFPALADVEKVGLLTTVLPSRIARFPDFCCGAQQGNPQFSSCLESDSGI